MERNITVKLSEEECNIICICLYRQLETTKELLEGSIKTYNLLEDSVMKSRLYEIMEAREKEIKELEAIEKIVALAE